MSKLFFCWPSDCSNLREDQFHMVVFQVSICLGDCYIWSKVIWSVHRLSHPFIYIILYNHIYVCVILNGLNTTNRNSCLPLTLFTCGAQYDWRMGIAQKASQSRWWMSIPAMVIQTVRGVDELMKAMVPQWCFFCTWTLRRPQNGKCGKCTKMFGSEKTHTLTIYICMYIYNIVYNNYIYIYTHTYTWRL